MQESIRVLVVDDEEPLRRLLKKELTRKGFSVEVAADGRAAVEILKENTFDILLLDIIMPGIDGISLMKKLQSDPASPAIIVLTGRATVETAVEAMKHGAYDYLTKPYKLDELVIVINRAYEYGKLSMKSRLFQQELVRKDTPAEFLCTSRQMKDILALIKKIAPTDSPVFIQGESGTGKEIVANTIWRMSKRNSFPFIALNCASLSENLIESEIFGHEKGAFTNAYQTKNGIVEVADKGTLFLDEIGEMPLGPQAKLLRFLDSGEFRRVGSNKALVVNVRLITATNKKLAELVKKGEFREDLYYRLNVINIQVPPLRERPDDIPGLAVHFLKKYSREMSKQIKEFTPRAIETLNTYAWPGNVRELENVIERAVILSDAESIDFEDLSMPAQPPKELSANPSLEEIEKDYILRVLREANSNQSKASHILGIDRKTLYLKLKKYGIG
ncbi:Acetoacetate metabolism regulatory protein AtoC [Candidatus Sulfobium mesophilum]|uniref:Acetoacetate metabolism regulatory protein AtoC n=1 Tax=Candidatus Sulfobium mesophilum TaxID=2016548 RepID=A0A2U3QI57_9BACT|nr:Acetoacetate metabolism regulatory protein AtoC [Candidatus Sulfobium mesophilum]